jgi:hypothetical protein
METIQCNLVEKGDHFHIILHQINCLTVNAHGLSDKLFEKFPYSNVYGQRKQEGRRNLAIPSDRGIPGNITVSWEKDKPVIIGLLAQYDFSTVHYQYRRKIIEETVEMREKWFKECLEKVGEFLRINPQRCIVGIPFKIGCGLAGGKWERYHSMLSEWTEGMKKENPNVRVYLCKV